MDGLTCHSLPCTQVGSDDFDVRVFQNEDVVAETSEADQFVGLCAIYGPKFGYALVNGTIGTRFRLACAPACGVLGHGCAAVGWLRRPRACVCLHARTRGMSTIVSHIAAAAAAEAEATPALRKVLA